MTCEKGRQKKRTRAALQKNDSSRLNHALMGHFAYSGRDIHKSNVRVSDDVKLPLHEQVTLISFPLVEGFHGAPEPKGSGPRASAIMTGQREKAFMSQIQNVN